MKKRILMLLVLISAVTAVAQAQIQFGVKGGLNVTSISDNVLESSNRTGFFIGPTVKFTIPIVGLSLDASALYDQRDAKVGDGTANTDVSLKQIAVPINLRYGWGIGSLASVFLFAGPQFGFNVGDKDFSISDVGDWSLKTANISANVGVGAMVLSHLQVTVNYNIGLSNSAVLSSSGTELSTSKTNTWQVSLGYFF